MTDEEVTNLRTVRQYLAALQAGESGDALRQFFAEDVRQVELPNRLNPEGSTSDLGTILARSVRGKELLQSQTFEVLSEMAQGSRASVEAHWSGVLRVPMGQLAAGATLQAHVAMFFVFKDGRISLQRNYDCFERW